MYEELIKRLREAPSAWRDAELHYKAADAIEAMNYELKSLYKLLGTHPDPRGENGEAGVKCMVLSKMEKTTQWIPVTEALPRMWEEVMLRFPNNQAVGFHDGDSGWAVFSGDNMYTYVAPEEVHPTHWMPKGGE